MIGDLSVIGPKATLPRRVAASATRFEAGEILIFSGLTMSSGAASANVCTLAAADCVVIATDFLAGIPIKGAKPYKTGTLVAQTVQCACPVPFLGRIRGKGETAASIDTAAELLAIINDAVLIDYNATGGADGGELYTVKVAASADTSGFQVVDGDTARGTLDVVAYDTIYRADVT